MRDVVSHMSKYSVALKSMGAKLLILISNSAKSIGVLPTWSQKINRTATATI